MLMETKLEEIKKRVVEVFPEIMELSFGCETEFGTITKVEGIELR